MLDQVKAERGLPKVIRTDNGPEFAGRTMQTWAAKNGVELRFIQPGKPVQNAYIESFNSRFRDECLSQHWFASLSYMRSVIDNWRDGFNNFLQIECDTSWGSELGDGNHVELDICHACLKQTLGPWLRIAPAPWARASYVDGSPE